jgi:anti-sigma factor RsiW
MNTRQMESRIIAYIDGDLMPAERQRVADAVAGQHELAEAAQEWQERTAEWRDALAFPDAPYTFATLRARLAHVRPIDEIRLFLPRVRLDSPLPRLVVASLFLAALGVSWMAGKLARSHGVEITQRMSDRSAHVDDMIELTADPNAEWPGEKKA